MNMAIAMNVGCSNQSFNHSVVEDTVYSFVPIYNLGLSCDTVFLQEAQVSSHIWLKSAA